MDGFSPVIIHVDMDAFFAAVEMRNNPNLKGRPVIVGGGLSQRGVVSTCSYEARRFGVHSGMSTIKAYQLCPQAVFVSSGLRGYVYVSAQLLKIFGKYSPRVEPISVDEAFLDITGTERLHGGTLELVSRMKRDILEETNLTCSVGIAPGKYLAKLASGLNKPDGITVMDREIFKNLFYDKPVDSLWGVGESTRKSLSRCGIDTVGELARSDPQWLKRLFGKNGGGLSVMARGTENGEVMRFHELPQDKSMSHETTVSRDLQDPHHIQATLLWLADKVARRMRKSDYIARTISVKIRSYDFKTITRAHTIQRGTDRCDVIYNFARKLVPREYGMKIPVRLLGVRVSHLVRTRSRNRNSQLIGRDQTQLDLNTGDKKYRELTRAIDNLRDKYGENVIKQAGTLVR